MSAPTNRTGWTWDAETARWWHVSGWSLHLDWLTNKWEIRDKNGWKLLNRPRGSHKNAPPVLRKYLLDAMKIAEREAGQ